MSHDRMDLDFTGQTVLVTGAAQGIGRALVTQFARHGARVVAGDIDAAGLQATLREAGDGCQAQGLDVTDRHAVQAAVAASSQAVAPGMKAAGRGRIIFISSGAGLGISLTGIQAYASAKAAEIGLARQLGHELGPFGITVNSIAPGFIRSNPSTEAQWQALGEAGQQALVNSIAMRRTGRPEDVAHAALFLASAHAGWINGQVLAVDGGR